jgi:hypothetical protein
MKQVSEKDIGGGKRRVVVDLNPGERLLAVHPDAHYMLGDPVGDVIAGHILESTQPVAWCSVSQKWVE